MAEEGVVAGFDREDGSGPLDYFGVGNGEASNNINDSTDTNGGDYVGQSEELIDVADGEGIFARRKSRRVVRFQYVLGRLYVDALLRLHTLDDFDCVVVLMVRVPFR